MVRSHFWHAGLGSENTTLTLAAVFLTEVEYTIYSHITPLLGLSSELVGASAMENFVPVFSALTDGFASFRSVITAGCRHEGIVVGRKQPIDLTPFCWIILFRSPSLDLEWDTPRPYF